MGVNTKTARLGMMVGILLLAAGLRLVALGADVRFHGDEALFATYARTAAVHGDWWLVGPLDKPPVPMYAMALSMQAAGVEVTSSGVFELDLRRGEWAARLPSVWFGVITTAALMVLARRTTGGALWSGFIWAVSPMAVGFDAMALTDPAMMAGFAVSMAAAVSNRAGLAGAAWAFAFASKQQAVLVLPIVVGVIGLSQLIPMWYRITTDSPDSQAEKGRFLTLLSQFIPRRRNPLGRFILAAIVGVGLLFLWDALRPGLSINSVAADNNNPYRLLVPPSEWGDRVRLWLDFIGSAFGALGGLLTLAGVVFAAVRLSTDRANRLPNMLLLGYPIVYAAAHIVLPFNVYERYTLPAVFLLTLPTAALLAWLMVGPRRAVLPLILAAAVLVAPPYTATTPRDTDHNLTDLAAFVNAQGLGTIVYNRWLGWEMGYYLGAWTDKRVVHYPTPDTFAADAPLNPDTAPRLFIAPHWADTAPWLAAAEGAGFTVRPAYENWGYSAWWLEPSAAFLTAHFGGDSGEIINPPSPALPPQGGKGVADMIFLGGMGFINSSTRLKPFINVELDSPSLLVGEGVREWGGDFIPHHSSLISQHSPPEGGCPSLTRTTLPSERLGRDVTVSVYLPCIEGDGRLPYLIFLHGSNRDDRQLAELGLEQAAPPFAVVMPFGGDEANTNEFTARAWGDTLIDLIPAFEESWPLDPDRRAIGGISRGGFWAYHVGLRQPEMFRAIGGHSAFFDPLALTLDPASAPTLYLDRGADDYAAPGLDRMDAALGQVGVPHTYVLRASGEHNETYWREHLPEYLAFYAAALTDDDPTPTAPPEIVESPGVALFVPVAAFPSPVYDLDPAALVDLTDPKLTVSADVRAALEGFGVMVPPGVRTLNTADEVRNELFRDRSRWTILPWDALDLRLRVVMVGGVHPVDVLADGAYPLAFESDAPNFDPAKLSRVMVSGVTALARGTLTALRENGIEWAAEDIAPLTNRADLFHLSSEVSVIDNCPNAPGVTRLGGNTSFCGDPAHLELFTLLGADLIELSGNHNADYGYPAYLDTLDRLRADGLATVGGGATLAEARAPFIWEGAGGSVAWLACNAVGPFYALADDAAERPGAAPCDSVWLRGELPRLKSQYDVVILTVQYFEFDQHNPTADQRTDFATYASWGADYVGGTQAHFAQSLNVIPGYGGQQAFVHYGLGNFLFDQPFWAGVRFFLDELYIYDGRLHSVAVYPGIIEGQGRPRLMTPTERENFWFVLFNQYGEF
ncbi:MAG: CapA family protein [Anaerolineae bacterium]|nr:CapA family protein [Anaerolineae bacterium]